MKKQYVSRDKEGNIIAIYGCAQPDNDEVEEIEVQEGSEVSLYMKRTWRDLRSEAIIYDETGKKIGGGYGTTNQQLEILGEQGAEALREHIMEVKDRIPKQADKEL